MGGHVGHCGGGHSGGGGHVIDNVEAAGEDIEAAQELVTAEKAAKAREGHKGGGSDGEDTKISQDAVATVAPTATSSCLH